MKDLSSNKPLIDTWRKLQLHYFNSLKWGLNFIHDKRTSHLSPSLSSQCSAILKMSAIFDRPENILNVHLQCKSAAQKHRIRQSWLYFTNLIESTHDTRIKKKWAYTGQLIWKTNPGIYLYNDRRPLIKTFSRPRFLKGPQ